ncbi:MAG TPA: type II toxin-antitoxin system prevent-host-death family antitoxin [Bauldia sp.]|nr:type II toxin-antitoxin system prevent-host-death family antitoxin [Bauldia sp.]
MDRKLSAAEANRQFSAVLRGVRAGQSFVVTSHGRPVARIVPAKAETGAVAEAARGALLDRLRNQPATPAGRWTRDDLYEDNR